MKRSLSFFLLCCLALPAAAQTNAFLEDFSTAPMPGLPAGWTTTFTSGGFNPLGWVVTDTTQKFYDKLVPVRPAHNRYVLVNDWYKPYNTLATLTSPAFSLAGVTVPYLNFDYYYFAGNNGNSINPAEKAWINLSVNGGASWTTIDTFTASGFDWKARYFSLAAYAGQTNVKLQFVYKDNGAHMYGLALDNIRVFNAPAKDLVFVAAKPVDGDPAADYFMPGATVTFGATVLNQGTQPVTAFTASYRVGNGAPVSVSNSTVTIPPFSTYTFTLPSAPHTVGPAGLYPITMWTTLSGDSSPGNDTGRTRIYSATHWPKKRVFYEEGTGTWCGYCVRGFVYMDSLRFLYDTSVSIVAVHSGNDPMAAENTMTEHYDEILGQAISYSYPSIWVDRYRTGDPVDVFYLLQSQKTRFGLAELELTNVQVSGNTMSVTAKVTPATDLQGDYRLELLLTEDDVHNTNAAYAQHNYYSYQDQDEPLSGMGYNFQDSVQLIPATSMYYDQVARATVPDLFANPNGVPGSLPASMNKGVPYIYTFSGAPLSASWVKSKLRPVVVLINNANGYVYNSAVPKSSLSVAEVAANAGALAVYPNPAASGAVAALELKVRGTVTLQVQDMQGRTVWQLPAQTLSAGRHGLSIPTGQFAPGIYQVTATNEGSRLSTRLAVVR